MITKQEILDFSKSTGLRPEVVEKDYVLGWILAGIHAAKPTTSHWIFKGGTCLKKCFFENYRFSEDLDFTLAPSPSSTAQELILILKSLGPWIYESSGIIIPEESVEIKTNPRGTQTFIGKIGYIGPLSKQQNGTYKIKFDFSGDEILILPTVDREILHPYSDKEACLFKTTTYAYEELFSEKIRALSERLRPRDLYDVIHLYHHRTLLPDRHTLVKTLQKKCAFKNLPFPTLKHIECHTKKEELYSEWQNMLDHQLQKLPSIDLFWGELPSLFEWLEVT